MRARIGQLGRIVDIDFTGAGTTVRVVVPLKRRPAVALVRILIADDHEIVRRDVRRVLEGELGWIVCGEARTGREAVTKAVDLRPEIAVLDLDMPELSGLEATRQIRRLTPAKVLILTGHQDDAMLPELINAGAHGCVLKSLPGHVLVEALRLVIDGGEFFLRGLKAAAVRQPAAHHALPADLTPREREVLQLIAEGRSNKEIGALLGITTKTAETHRAHILGKLDLHSASQLVRYAIRNHIIEP